MTDVAVAVEVSGSFQRRQVVRRPSALLTLILAERDRSAGSGLKDPLGGRGRTSLALRGRERKEFEPRPLYVDYSAHE